MYTTLEAQIDNGRITVDEPQRLPEHAKALLTILTASEQSEDRCSSVRRVAEETAGVMRSTLDAGQWQRDVRKQWIDR